jgi:hypothetical protein
MTLIITDSDLAILCALSVLESPPPSENEKCGGPFDSDTKHSTRVPTVAEYKYDTAFVFVNSGQCGRVGAGLVF